MWPPSTATARLLGQHKGGFSTFRFDLTAAMRPTGNVLRVDVSNAPSDIYPQTADFTFFGGPVPRGQLHRGPPPPTSTCSRPAPAPFLSPPWYRAPPAWICSRWTRRLHVSVDLKDASGAVVASASAPAEAHTVLTLSVKAPHLWNGMADPYCYTAEASLLRGDEVLDTVAVDYGYRSFHVDPNTGFWLNGKNTPPARRGPPSGPPGQGLGHQPRRPRGGYRPHQGGGRQHRPVWPLPARPIFLRPVRPYRLCGLGRDPLHQPLYPRQEAHDNTLSQMTELVAQNYNHPSILLLGHLQ